MSTGSLVACGQRTEDLYEVANVLIESVELLFQAVEAVAERIGEANVSLEDLDEGDTRRRGRTDEFVGIAARLKVGDDVGQRIARGLAHARSMIGQRESVKGEGRS